MDNSKQKDTKDNDTFQFPQTNRLPNVNILQQSKLTLSPLSPSKSCENLFTSDFLTLENNDEKRNASEERSKIKIEENDRFANFLSRMEMDLERRRTKDKRRQLLFEKSKIKHSEEEIVNGFNRLIDDANRRIEVKQKMEELSLEINGKKKDKNEKTYDPEKWKEVYQSRFEKFKNTVQEKIVTKKKEKEEAEKKEIEEYVEQMKNKTIKVPKDKLTKICQRLYNGRRLPPKLVKKEEEIKQNEVQKQNIKETKEKQKKNKSKSPKKIVKEKTNIVNRLYPKNLSKSNLFKNRIATSKSPCHNVIVSSTINKSTQKKTASKSSICRVDTHPSNITDIEQIEEKLFSNLSIKEPELSNHNDFNYIKQHRPECLKVSIK